MRYIPQRKKYSSYIQHQRENAGLYDMIERLISPNCVVNISGKIATESSRRRSKDPLEQTTMTAKKANLVERLRALAKEHGGEIKTAAEIDKEYTVPQIESLIETYEQPADATAPEPAPAPAEIEPSASLMTFGDVSVNTETGETHQTASPTEISAVSDKIGYIQAQGQNRVGFPSEIKALTKALYYHPTNCKDQQRQLAKGLQYAFELMGCNLTNKADGDSVDNFAIDSDWVTWFKQSGAALMGQFTRIMRDPAKVAKYQEFVKAL